VCLGATAAKSLLGPRFQVTEQRGQLVASDLAPHVLATVHPSSILRGDPADRERALQAFVADLGVAASVMPRARRS
jgi:uracil-DNA glycosylase